MNLSENIKDPKPPRFLMYGMISEEQAKILYEGTHETVNFRENFKIWLKPEILISGVSLISDWNIDEKVEIVLDFISFHFEFCIWESFTPLKISTCLNLSFYILSEALN